MNVLAFFFRKYSTVDDHLYGGPGEQPGPDLPDHQYHPVDRRYIYGHDPGNPHLYAHFPTGSHPTGHASGPFIGVCTPPVGTLLFVGSGVAKISVSDVIPPLIPLLVTMIVVLLLVTYIPAISMWLPGLFGL